MAVGFRWRWPALSRRPPQSGLPWSRFPSPLIEPDVPISDIRLCASEGQTHLPSITATSACGYKQTFSRPKSTSALPPTSDIQMPMPALYQIMSASPPIADIPVPRLDYRF